jgi:hypothetical protein
MFELALLANLNRGPEMTCLQVREIAETVVESKMKDRDKEMFLTRLFGRYMTLKCIKE